MLMPADAVESWLNVDQRCGKPSMPLFRVTPPLDVSGQFLGHAVYGLDTVGGSKAFPQVGHHAQTVDGQRFLESFFKALDGLLGHQSQLRIHGQEICFGFVVCRLFIGFLHLALDTGLLSLGQV